MRYSKDHKAHAKAAILREASGTLKEKGFHAVGVDTLAAAANVTSGAIYSNFAGKEGLLEEVVAAELGLQFAGIADPDPAERRRRLAGVLHLYLSDEHRTDPATGCVMPSLSADVARAGDSVRETYRSHMADLVAILAPAMHGTPEEQAKQAWTMIASIVGAVTVARALPPGAEARAVLEATLDTLMRTLADDH
ncbi:TetR/AcrR family transcriptional regulator [Streptomyces sp. MI02-7b]|uniref:TetR/AcrR family transcriptional regulator n=1 Tax=Streptomyces sp. MI02-7b TaxID=462941 RepID=UPI0029AD9B11|nr:TetR/AcrR family transcriptional regulator [Streptomyces sp. MI02-7b]MDX3074944.1 TetR/AcrR family transcriptional regulator [Streptomyces sp. MI02-7b]